MAQCIFHNKGLIHNLWVKAIATATYLKNRSLSNYLEGVTLLEVWNGKKPNVCHLKVFGSIALVHKPKKLKSKLDSKTTQGLFMGYKRKSYKV